MSLSGFGRCTAVVLVSVALALVGTVPAMASFGAQSPAQTHA
jgi:hypothetical protein